MAKRITGLFLIFVATAAAQLLLHIDSVDGITPTAVRGFAADAAVRLTPVSPSPDTLFAVAQDFCTPDELNQIRRRIESGYSTAKGAPSVRIALVHNGIVKVYGPFATKSSLRAALNELSLPEGQFTSDPPSAARFYSELVAAITAPISLNPKTAGHRPADWPMLILTGALPGLSRELHGYGSAYLLRKFIAAGWRFSYWNLGAENVSFLDPVATYTGGSIYPGGDASGETHEFATAEWESFPVTRGFHLYDLGLISSASAQTKSIPYLAVAADFPLPDIAGYQQLQIHVRNGQSAFQNRPITQDQANRIRQELQAAFLINPLDANGLEMAAELYELAYDHRQSATFLEMLAELHPPNAKSHAEIAHRYYLSNDLEHAERSHRRARELGWSSAESAEELARIYLSQKNAEGALPFVEESLRIRSDNQGLWFLRAELFHRRGDWQQQSISLEKGVALGGDVYGQRIILTRLLIEHKEEARALKQVQAAVPGLPRSAKAHIEWAQFLEELHRPDDSLPLWRTAAALDPSGEEAHYSIARILFSKNDFGECLTAAENGLIHAPQSTRILLIKVSAQEAQGRIQEARQTLQNFDPLKPDIQILERTAALEDVWGGKAPAAYQALAQIAPRESVLARGLKTSLRENDLARAAWFAEKLHATGQSGVAGLAAKVTEVDSEFISLPGGRDALAFIAKGKSESSPDRFLAEYARTIVHEMPATHQKITQEYLSGLKDYFQRLSTLVSLGTTSDKELKTRIVLTLTNKQSQRHAERVLAIFGWKLRTNNGRILVESGEKASQAKKQDLASALAIDQVGLQQAFSDAKPFEILIPWERVPIVIRESEWKRQFYPKDQFFGGLAEAMARDPDLARVYAGLSSLNRATSAALVNAFGLRGLAQKQGDKLRWFASCLAVEAGRVVVPGGGDADRAWTQLTGANPKQPATFLKALFDKDRGALLAFYSEISALDFAHQRFFTATPQRVSRFYELFRGSPEGERDFVKPSTSDTFGDFLREIPLDNDGSVDFPGSPEIWMVAKGKSTSVEKTTKLLTKAHRKVAPDDEDAILIRLASTRYKANSLPGSELENFVAVTRIQNHREQGLDEQAALLLAQNFNDNKEIYPYFALFRDLTGEDFACFFALSAKYRLMKPSEAEAPVAHFASLIEILRLSLEAGSIDEKRAAQLFRSLCERLSRVSRTEDITASSIQWIKELLPLHAGDSPARSLRTAILGTTANAEWDFGRGTRRQPILVEISKKRETDYERVLEQQKVPSLDALFAISDAASALGRDPRAADSIAADIARLPTIEVEKSRHLQPEEKHVLAPFSLERLQRTAGLIRQRTSRGKKINAKDLEKLTSELFSELEPQLRLALAGAVYGYYFRPSDLAVADDTLFLRKHRFVQTGAGSDRTSFKPAKLDSEAAGAFLAGTFGDMATAAATLALFGARAASGNRIDLSIAQIASVRSTHWQNFGNPDQRLFALRTRAAREWIVEAAADPTLRATLGSATYGLLSLNRRRDLLDGLDRHDWQLVWQSITLGDLNMLADVLPSALEHLPSPIFPALADATKHNGKAGLDVLGPNLPRIYGCAHPHLMRLPPYETFERHLFTGHMAERTSELKLYLAEYLERRGIPAAFVGALAEPLALDLLSGLQMADGHDWRSAVTAFSKISDDMIEGVLSGK